MNQREVAYDTFVAKNLRRNFLANLSHGILGMTGFRMAINTPTFVPVYLHVLANGVMTHLPAALRTFMTADTIVGLGLSLEQIGGIVSPVIGAAHIEHRRKMMPVAAILGTAMRLQILGMAVCGWVLSGLPLLVAMLVFLTLLGLFSGAQRVAFQIVMAKVIPINRRGLLQGWSNIVGSLVAAVLSWVAGRYFVGTNPLSPGVEFLGIRVFHNGYSTTFFLAFVLTSLGLSSMGLLLKEPEPPTLRPRIPIRNRLAQLPHLFNEDRGFRYFILAQICATANRASAPFYILFASGVLPLTGTNIGCMAVAMTLGDALSNLLWGSIGDRSGFKSTFAIALGLWIGSTLILIFAGHRPLVMIAFFGLGAAQSGYLMSSRTMVLEFGRREDMAMRLAFSSMAEGIMLTFAPLLGGLVASLANYVTVFSVSIVFEIIALIVLLRLVDEPRRRMVAG